MDTFMDVQLSSASGSIKCKKENEVKFCNLYSRVRKYGWQYFGLPREYRPYLQYLAISRNCFAAKLKYSQVEVLPTLPCQPIS